MDYSNLVTAECAGLCSGTTISPRYLSKHHSPSLSPEHSEFGLGEGNYETIIHDISEGTFCEELRAVWEEEQEEDREEEELIPDSLGTRPEFYSSESDAPGDGVSSLSSAESSVPPETPSSRKFSLLPMSLSETDSDPTTSSKHQSAAQCSFPSRPPGGPHRSLRLKLASKETPISNIAKISPKESVKEQNLLLLRWRSQGISYKTIKERLGIDEAESTLRGRLRTLTKPKNERLRRPQWMEKDVRPPSVTGTCAAEYSFTNQSGPDRAAARNRGP